MYLLCWGSIFRLLSISSNLSEYRLKTPRVLKGEVRVRNNLGSNERWYNPHPPYQILNLCAKYKCRYKATKVQNSACFAAAIMYIRANLRSHSGLVSWRHCAVLAEATADQVISHSYVSQSASRKGCPNRNPFCCMWSIISFVILYETSWNFLILSSYENYSPHINLEP